MSTKMVHQAMRGHESFEQLETANASCVFGGQGEHTSTGLSNIQ